MIRKTNLKKRRQTDINYKIRTNLRTRMYNTIIQGKKSTSTIELIGCSIDKLKQHLEIRFLPGMTWKNYGKMNKQHTKVWHIDHIVPCTVFDLKNLNEQKKCFHYTNLQPLWAIDNIKKGNRIGL